MLHPYGLPEYHLIQSSKPWFQLWPPNVPKTIDYPEVPLQELLYRAAKAYPERISIVYDDREITYAELETFSNQFANALATLGVTKGDRIALFLPNIPQFIIAYFGVLKAGAIVTA